ncbi:MAG: hypothetical protein HY938_09210 [Nitrosomonadales bacterium]|nr:hypothetical protein [Nitrosomonadales bacterium]
MLNIITMAKMHAEVKKYSNFGDEKLMLSTKRIIAPMYTEATNTKNSEKTVRSQPWRYSDCKFLPFHSSKPKKLVGINQPSIFFIYQMTGFVIMKLTISNFHRYGI